MKKSKKHFEVICYGSLNIDIFTRIGGEIRNFRDGEKIHVKRAHLEPGGSGSNIAVALARLKKRVGFVSNTTKDAMGDYLINNLKQENIIPLVSRVAGTIPFGVQVETGSQKNFLKYPGVNDKIVVPASVYQNYSSDFVVASGIYQFNLGDLYNFLKRFETKYRMIVPSPALCRSRSRKFLELLKEVDIIQINNIEATHLLAKKAFNLSHSDDFKKLSLLGPKQIIITQGKKGAVHWQNGTITKVGAPRAKAVDPTGAGDGFCAGFVLGTLNGWPLSKKLKAATIVAAMATTKMGARSGLPSLSEFKKRYT